MDQLPFADVKICWCGHSVYVCSIQVAVYGATALLGCYAWASSSGFAPTGRQIIDGFLDDAKALFKSRSILSSLLALLSLAAAAVGTLIVREPLAYFQPDILR